MPFVLQVGISASQDRLENLIAERLQPGADKDEIDNRIWDLFGETWAIMFTDLAGFSRRAAEYGIIHFLQTIYESQRLLVPCIDDHDGILLKMDGDSMMVLFRKPAKAIECAIQMQGVLKEYNATKIENEQILLCVGIGYGLMLLLSGLAALPGGLGLTEASLAVIFARLGAPGAVAIAAALTYRLLAFWLLRLVGFASWQVLEVRRGSGPADTTAF